MAKIKPSILTYCQIYFKNKVANIGCSFCQNPLIDSLIHMKNIREEKIHQVFTIHHSNREVEFAALFFMQHIHRDQLSYSDSNPRVIIYFVLKWKLSLF